MKAHEIRNATATRCHDDCGPDTRESAGIGRTETMNNIINWLSEALPRWGRTAVPHKCFAWFLRLAALIAASASKLNLCECPSRVLVQVGGGRFTTASLGKSSSLIINHHL